MKKVATGPAMIYDLCVWFLYFPVRKAVLKTGGKEAPRIAMRIADIAAELEHLVFRKRNQAFEDYLAFMFNGTPLAGREKEIAKKSMRYRTRRSLGMLIEDRTTAGSPIVNREHLARTEGRGGCLPLLHLGYHYSAQFTLGANLAIPCYSGQVMKNSMGLIADRNNKVKQDCVASHGGHIPVYDRDRFMQEVLPAVATGKACYFSIFDILTPGSKVYPLLGGKVVLAIEPSAKFAIKNMVPIIPYFALGERIDTRRVVLETPIDPLEGVDSVEAVEERYVPILERYVLENPEVVDWLLWWKRLEAYNSRQRIDKPK